MIELDKIPKHWVIKKLGEICETTSGGTPSRRESKYYNGEIPWVKSGELDKGIITDTEEKITEEAIQNSSAKIFPKGTLLIALYGATIGKLAFLGVNAATNQAVCGIFKNEYVSQKYLYNFLFLSKRDLVNRGIGGAQPNISQGILKNLSIPLPPVVEQQAIVSKIEELFSELDKSIESLRTAQQQLKTYRQAVLKWAFEGKLTEEWRKKNGAGVRVPTGSPAERSRVRDPFSPQQGNGVLPEGWKWVKTGDIIGTINNGYTPSKEYLFEGGGEIPFIKVYNLNFDGSLNFKKNPTFIPDAIHKKDLKRSVSFPGDVLINIVGPPLGKVSIVTNQYPEWNINQAIVLFRPNDKILSKYIAYFLLNPVTINWLENTSKATAGQWNVKVSTCREIPMAYCSLEEQKQIIQEIESRLSVTDKLQETITHSLQQAEALRQSILKEAFEGKLVTVKEPAKVIPIERKALACHIINLNHSHRYFGSTKFQKALYLCEQFAEVEYETHYEQERAGPYDRAFTTLFKKEMTEEDWFRTETKVSLTHFLPGANAGKLSMEYVKHFRAKGQKIRFVLELLKEKTLFEAELIATIYAVWNNAIIKRLAVDIDLITGDVYNWSTEKMKYTRDDIVKMFNWMKLVGLVPNGFGKEIKKAIN